LFLIDPSSDPVIDPSIHPSTHSSIHLSVPLLDLGLDNTSFLIRYENQGIIV
jgi:hypothetical protein